MTISRRSIVGVLGAIAGGGKAAAEAVISHGVPLGADDDGDLPLTTAGMMKPPDPEVHRFRVDSARRALDNFLKMKDRARETILGEPTVIADPDLIVNRSLSLGAKVRIQRERDIERAMVRRETQLRRNLKRMILGDFNWDLQEFELDD